MKLKLEPDEVAELLEAANVIQVKGFRVQDINWNRTYDNFEVLLEKSPVDQAVDSHYRNQLARRPPPTPSTPPFVPEYDKDRDNPLPER